MIDREYPRLSARTQRFTLGRPRDVKVASDGSRVMFLRSPSGTDPCNGLWVFDVATRQEHLVVDPRTLESADDLDVPDAERARRERQRESAGGITSYATDEAGLLAVFPLSGRIFLVDLISFRVRELPSSDSGIDPRLDPAGRRVAYVSDGSLRVLDLNSGGDVEVAGPALEPAGPDEEDRAAPQATARQGSARWGSAEFIAAEEMGRHRGHWWAPDGTSLLVTRVDESDVPIWWLGDPSRPEAAPRRNAYPAAGTVNADVRLFSVAVDPPGSPIEITGWDRAAYPYLTRVCWTRHGPPLVAVQSRDQRRLAALALKACAAPAGGTRAAKFGGTPVEADVLAEIEDEHWVELVPGSPAWSEDGRLLIVRDDPDSDTRRVWCDGTYITPPGLQVRGLDADSGTFSANESADPASMRAYEFVGANPSGPQSIPDGQRIALLSPGYGWHAPARGGDVTVLASSTLETDGSVVAVSRAGEVIGHLASLAVRPPGAAPTPVFLHSRASARLASGSESDPESLLVAVLLPTGHVSGSRRLPVILDPYGGPHAQRVLAARSAWWGSQWLADRGFAVVVADGRGTPGRGPAWERAVWRDLAGPVLEDQITALRTATEAFPDLDDTRVGIRGWSFGGFLAALAVLRRPDVFHAAVAGAPVTDWRLYDTHYTERYLGDPASEPEAYERCSLLVDAARPVNDAHPARPLLLIHGLADDNVVAAHTLRLSAALLAAGRAHSVLPLSGVTHMTPQEVVAENLLVLQVEFLRNALKADSLTADPRQA